MPEKISKQPEKEFPAAMEYKGNGYGLQKVYEDGTAMYICLKKSRFLGPDQPGAIQVDGEGKIIWEDLDKNEE